MKPSSPPRILFIGSGIPWTSAAGYLVRQNMFLNALSAQGELHAALFDCPGDSLLPVPPFPAAITALPSPVRVKPNRIQSLLADKFNPLPRMLRGYDLTTARAAVQALHPEQFDAVFAYRIDFAYLAGVLNHPRLILDIDDPEHLRWQRRLRTTSPVIDVRSQHDLHKLEAFEKQAVARAKLAFVCQENDRGVWPSGANVQVVPNCVPVLEAPRRIAAAPIVLFVGNCAGSAVSPNVDAVLWFLQAIWPGILAQVPAARFHLVGAASDAVKTAVQKAPQAVLRGFVDDLSGVYEQSALSVAPLRFGTGTRIKILEAFAHACPVLATLVGAEGISAVPGREIELASHATDFTTLAVQLLRDPVAAEKIGQGGYALARRQYDVRARQALLIEQLRAFVIRENLPERKIPA